MTKWNLLDYIVEGVIVVVWVIMMYVFIRAVT